MLKIGPYEITGKTILAPMAGVTDLPYRKLCKKFGAGLVVSEMITSDPSLRSSRKTQLRMTHEGEIAPRVIQIAGSDPYTMAEAAAYNVEQGAEIIDINMGCPAKKVCNKAAGSALMKDESLVERILTHVVSAVDVPVTLKTRTGWDTAHKNGLTIAKIAENAGISALTIHGRTRACAYKGNAEYDTVAAIKNAISIPVIANGDINSPQKAKFVLEHTQADAVMIGRAAHGQPWIFRDIECYLETGSTAKELTLEQKKEVVIEHLLALHNFYGQPQGLRIARKHIGWYLQSLPQGQVFRTLFNKIESPNQQLHEIESYFESLAKGKERCYEYIK